MSLRFGPFTLDGNTRQLTREGRAIGVSPKAFELLLFLLEQRPRALSKSELQERLWPETFVAEANLSNLVAELRKALGDRRRTPTWIRTVHGFGYAFCGDATSARGAGAVDRPVCWLAWGTRQFPLPIGEHVIGRDRHADVQLDLSTVSRKHARVVVRSDGATLEDCGSKNGTWRGDRRVAGAPLTLIDGDDIRIGSVRLTFHAGTHMRSTETIAEATS